MCLIVTGANRFLLLFWGRSIAIPGHPRVAPRSSPTPQRPSRPPCASRGVHVPMLHFCVIPQVPDRSDRWLYPSGFRSPQSQPRHRSALSGPPLVAIYLSPTSADAAAGCRRRLSARLFGNAVRRPRARSAPFPCCRVFASGARPVVPSADRTPRRRTSCPRISSPGLVLFTQSVGLGRRPRRDCGASAASIAKPRLSAGFTQLRAGVPDGVRSVLTALAVIPLVPRLDRRVSTRIHRVGESMRL